MTDTTPATQVPPAAPRRSRLWWALPVAAALVLILAESSAPVHAAFAEFDLFLFHAVYGILASIIVLGVTRAAERVLAQPGMADDD